jgi:hypothetical protein
MADKFGMGECWFMAGGRNEINDYWQAGMAFFGHACRLARQGLQI